MSLLTWTDFNNRGVVFSFSVSLAQFIRKKQVWSRPGSRSVWKFFHWDGAKLVLLYKYFISKWNKKSLEKCFHVFSQTSQTYPDADLLDTRTALVQSKLWLIICHLKQVKIHFLTSVQLHFLTRLWSAAKKFSLWLKVSQLTDVLAFLSAIFFSLRSVSLSFLISLPSQA